mgnify:CR=1 FL=1
MIDGQAPVEVFDEIDSTILGRAAASNATMYRRFGLSPNVRPPAVVAADAPGLRTVAT